MLVKDILSRTEEFRKPNNDQMARVLVGGLFSSEGKTWAQHKKILNPAFHIDKTKVPHLHTTRLRQAYHIDLLVF